MMQWEPVIGLEIHAQLNTKSKIFSGSATNFGADPNTQASLIDLGMPGTLPSLNKEAVIKAIKFGLSISATINQTSLFERKNYFYPDLPKGYQTSQFQLPIVQNGKFNIPLDNGDSKTIRINRAHLEEDAGKSLHEDYHGMTAIDLNRAGIPLLEIVTEPDFRSAKEAVSYMKSLHHLVRYLDICDGNMQEGSFRCDVNISLRPLGEKKLGTRAEIKNLNSFRFVEKAIQYEIKRQKKLLQAGQAVYQETRLYCPDNDETRAMRSKEEAYDYRYFPCPDLPPLVIDDNFITDIKKNLPEPPQKRKERLLTTYGLKEEDADYFVENPKYCDYLESLLTQSNISPKLAVNWFRGELMRAINNENLSFNELKLAPQKLGELLSALETNQISGKIAKQVFEIMWETGQSAKVIIEQQGLKQLDNTDELNEIIERLIEAYPKQVEGLKAGQNKLLGFFVGQVMKQTQGKANPKQVNDLIKQKLSLD